MACYIAENVDQKSLMLEKNCAVITGGGGVLGTSMAKALSEAGSRVAILDLNEASAKSIAENINKAGGDAIGVKANVLERESLAEAYDTVMMWSGGVDILINGAGGNHPKGTTTKTIFEAGDEEDPELVSFFDLEETGIQFVFNLNFLGTLLPTQIFAKALLKSQHAVIVNISSMNAFTPLTKIPAYSAAKAAVSNFTQWLAVHFAASGIRVNAIAPGFFLTEQNRTLLTKEDGSLTDRGETIIKRTPMGRFGKPEDLNGTLLWLCSPNSGFVTGTVIPVDGGFNAFSGV